MKNSVKKIALFISIMISSLTFFAQTPDYASFSGGLIGTGQFNCDKMPDFAYYIVGDIASGDTNIPGSFQVIENNGGGMESAYGPADGQQNIEVEVAGYGAGNDDGIGDPITNEVVTTISFDGPTIPKVLAFLIADVEQDQVIINALDANGNAVATSVIAGWYRSSFDADLSEGTNVAPTWDPVSGTLIGHFAPGGVKQENYLANGPDSEAGAAWFEVDIAITQLQFTSQAIGVSPDDPSQHFFLATRCPAPSPCEVPNCSPVSTLEVCNDATPIILECDSDLENYQIVWYDGLGNQVGTGCELVIDFTMIETGANGDIMCFYYVAIDADGCEIKSCCPIITEVVDCGPVDSFDLALIKTKNAINPGPFRAGDTVVFDLTVVNQGTINAFDIQVVDYIPSGLFLNDLDWIESNGEAVLRNPISSLDAGDSIILTITFEIDPQFEGNSIINDAEISSADDDADSGNTPPMDIDSTPNDNATPDDLNHDNDLSDINGGDDQDPGLLVICTDGDPGLLVEASLNDCLLNGVGSVTRIAFADGQIVPVGYELIYILVDANDSISQISATPEFIINTEGSYFIHTVIYNPFDFDASTAKTLTEIINFSQCVEIDLDGVEVDVERCCLADGSGGKVNYNPSSCAESLTGTAATIEVTSAGNNVPTGFITSYILASLPGSLIESINTTGSFSVLEPGLYAIYLIVHDPMTYSFQGVNMDQVDIFDIIQNVITTGVCADINLAASDILVKDCNECEYDVYVPGFGTSIIPGLYEAEHDIFSDGLVNMGQVQFPAGNSIELLPGFEVTLGNPFHAYIEGCSN